MTRTFFTEDEEVLCQFHADGVSRNDIARQMGWAVGTSTNHAQRLGLSFDREAVGAATDARQVDLTDQRQRAQQRAMDHFNLMLDRAQGQYRLTGFDHVGQFVAQLVPEPSAKVSCPSAGTTQAEDREPAARTLGETGAERQRRPQGRTERNRGTGGVSDSDGAGSGCDHLAPGPEGEDRPVRGIPYRAGTLSRRPYRSLGS